jgi:DNA polymerase (family 10)
VNRSKAAAVIAMVQDKGLLSKHEWHVAGSYRRGKKLDLHDVDIIVVSGMAGKDTHYILGEQVDIVHCTEDTLGPCLLYLTGSKEFNIQQRGRAKSLGLKLNRYGLFDRKTGARIDENTEQSIFAALDMEWRSPEER